MSCGNTKTLLAEVRLEIYVREKVPLQMMAGVDKPELMEKLKLSRKVKI